MDLALDAARVSDAPLWRFHRVPNYGHATNGTRHGHSLSTQHCEQAACAGNERSCIAHPTIDEGVDTFPVQRQLQARVSDAL